ncbi:S8 family serine peptidase [Actinoplanes sp. HUAS TT8]|uniref:S8 family serine peptidase n=1 Tax=Actinoplanes sp. HUAS TT8 TaxID=3447453 RepID=UPI003F51F56B
MNLRRLGTSMAALLVALTGAGLTASPASADPLGDGTAPGGPDLAGRYVVRLADAPLASYAGGVRNLKATRAPQGAKLSRTTADAGAYRSYLGQRRESVAKSARVNIGHSFDTTFNGFTATLTAGQADSLRKTAGVAAVVKDELVHAQVSTTADELGLTGRTGVWQQSFGGDKHAGEGTIIGVIDSGYWPESPSFAPMSEPRPDARTIAAKFKGTCDFGTAEPARCNNKVIGARWYDNDALSTLNPNEFKSPRDSNGHGTHTASTAAGLGGVHATVSGMDMGTITGMAPGARLSIYKALWSDGAGGAVGSMTDIIAAIEDAVADGVDVINYSVGDDSEAWTPIDEAFFNAAAAGVFVAAAAGNAGPGQNTVDNTLPWVTTVAATEQDHRWLRTIKLGNGKTYTGVGIGTAGTTGTLIDSTAAAAADDYSASLCLPGALDPAKVTGKVVLCARGESARTSKSQVVADAGGVGMVLYQPEWDPNALMADLHAVPTAHVDVPTGAALIAYAATAKPTIKIGAGTFTKVEAPAIAGFSSSGPSTLSGGDLIKPDVAAPGSDVVAAVSPAEHDGGFAMMSGTSMATPHIAGIAALVKQKHPDWDPTAIRSALMTGSRDKTDKGHIPTYVDQPATPLNYGSGEVVPATAIDPGLVYESTPAQWAGFLCGAYANREDSNNWGYAPDCTGIEATPAAALNYPSVAFGHMIGTRSIQRTVTNLGKRTSTYVAKIDAPKGYTVKVSPARFTVKPGASVTYTLTVTHAGGAFGVPVSGNLTWIDGQGHRVRSPILVNNTQLVTPDSLTGTGTSGRLTVPVQAGWQGRLELGPAGLTAGATTGFTLTGMIGNAWDDQYATIPDPAPPAMKVAKIHVPAGSLGPNVRIDAQYTRCFFDDDEEGACGDFYAKIFNARGEFVDAQFMHLPHTATLNLPDGAGDYTLVVEQTDLWNLPAGQNSQQLSYTVITPGAPGVNTGTFTATPNRSTIAAGSTTNATLRWSGLKAGTTYHGVVVISDGRTVVRRIPVTITG